MAEHKVEEMPAVEAHANGTAPDWKRKHPREIRPGDPMWREYTWSQAPAFECRFPTTFKAAAQTGRPAKQWKLACCKTYFTKAQLAEHMDEEHHIDPPAELEGD